MTPWRILADDLTGALDTAAAWMDAVPVFLDAPGPAPEPVQAVVTGTRDVPPASLAERLAPSLDWFTATGHAFKKVDSLLRGNSLNEVAWLMRSGRFDGVVFAPAFPGQGRFTAQSRHWVAPPHQADGPRTYEYPASLIDAFAAVGLRACVPAQPRSSLYHAGQVVIPDILDDADLDALAALTHQPEAKRWLWCGSAGLAWAFARHDGVAAGPTIQFDNLEPAAGRPLLLSASRHPVLREQLTRLTPLHDAIELIALTSDEDWPLAEAYARLDQAMHEIVAQHLRPPALAVVGGDTLLALCRALGVHGLRSSPSPRAGWGRATLLGGAWDGLICYSRSGAFGPPDDLLAMMTDLSKHTPTQEQH